MSNRIIHINTKDMHRAVKSKFNNVGINDIDAFWDYSLESILSKMLDLRKNSPKLGYTFVMTDYDFNNNIVEGDNTLPNNQLEEVRKIASAYNNDKFLAITSENMNWFIVSAKNKPRNGELRIYLDIKKEYLGEIYHKLLDGLSNLKSFFSSKINFRTTNREDALVLYFDPETCKDDMDAILSTINNIALEYKKKEINPFEKYSIINPLSERIFLEDMGPIGAIAYHPLRSSLSDLRIIHPVNPKSSINNTVWGSTPNQAYGYIIKALNEYKKAGGATKEFLEKSVVIPTFFSDEEKGLGILEPDKEFSLKEYNIKVLSELNKIIPKEYRH